MRPDADLEVRTAVLHARQRHLALWVFLLLFSLGFATRAAAAAPEADDKAPPEKKQAAAADSDEKHDDGFVQLKLDGALGFRLGGSVGNVLAVPFAVPGPGGTLDLAADVVFFRFLYVGAEAGLSLGQSDRPGDVPLAGYGAMARGGLVGDLGFFVGEAELHGGITSMALIPIPRAGVGLAGTLYLLRTDAMAWGVKGSLDLDALVIVPAPGAALSTSFRMNMGDAWGELVVGASGNAVVAVLANSLSGAVFIQLRSGITF